MKVLISLFFVAFCAFFSGCTYNISMVHTQGEASDVIDSNQSAEPDISPTVSIPAAAL